MFSPGEIQRFLDRVLLKVQKPGRYVGNELNQVVKPWDKVKTHIALVFPEIYDLGLPNLGLAILYEILNSRADVLAERAYSPWIDMEEEMRQAGIPLYSLESKHPLSAFDIIGISLPYETLYTNTLNIFDLARIPIFAKNRLDSHPLVIAGGHAAYNPEPMAAFIDAFVIGEGEEVINEIVDIQQRWVQSNESRTALLNTLSEVNGVYVPRFYEPVYNVDGTINKIEPIDGKKTSKIIKRIVAKLPPPPTRLLVPSIDVVHNRVSIEIMRGCTRGCRFCHAGMINRPVRERLVAEIIQAIDASLKNTGYEEVALLSLSSSDYTHIINLVSQVAERYKDHHLTISLPSLRIETVSINILEQLKGSRSGGFTLAPEAATDRMRNMINKPISASQLIDTTREIYRRGWTTIKLYFMIGHPSETIEDVQAISELCKAVLAEGRKVIGKRATLHVGVSTFIPKPHTPFQWAVCDSIEQIEKKQSLLRKTLTGPGLKFNWTEPKETMFESWLSRGDRRISEVIYQAWLMGAKFDAWQEHFQFNIWQEAFTRAGLDPDFYIHRTRNSDEVFPWDHIHTGVRKSYLLNEYQKSQSGDLRADCRDQCFACGILPTFSELRRQNPGQDWKCPEVNSPSKNPLIRNRAS